MEVQRGVRKGRKRKSLLKKAKKYGKKGKFGRGVLLDEDVYQYFVRVLELVQTNTFETDEEKGSKCVYPNCTHHIAFHIIVRFIVHS